MFNKNNSKNRLIVQLTALLILILAGWWLFVFNAPNLQAGKEINFSVNAALNSSQVKPGDTINLTLTVTSNTGTDISTDIVMVINEARGRTVYSQNWLKQNFSNGKSITYNVSYKSSFAAVEGNYSVAIKLQNSTKTEIYYNNPGIATFNMLDTPQVSPVATPVPGQSPAPAATAGPGATVTSAPEPSLVKSGVTILLRMDLAQDQNQLRLAQATGTRLIRLTLSWRLLEELGKGNYNASYQNYIDQILDYARSLKLQVLFVFGQTPCWASADPDKVCNATSSDLSKYKIWYPPTQAADFGAAFGYAVQRFGSRVVAWEMWNEPNLDIFWGYIKPDPARYTAMLKAAYTTGKKANPSTLVLGGGLAGSDISYLKGMYVAGAKGSYDAIAMHPYASNFTSDAPDVCTDSQWSFKCGIETVHNTMLEEGDNQALWLTEIGWSSYAGQGGVSEATQATYLTTAFKMTQDWDFVPVMIWYKLVDHKDDNESISDNSKETNFGLYREDLTPKPALTAFQKLFR